MISDFGAVDYDWDDAGEVSQVALVESKGLLGLS